MATNLSGIWCSDDDDALVFRYQPQDGDSKAILRYLAKTEEQQRVLGRELKKHGSELISIADEVEAKLPEVRRGRRTPEQICEECITNFMKRFSSWYEKLHDCSAADETFIISVLKKHRHKCHGNWYKDSSKILVTGPVEIVKEVKLSVEDHLGARIESETSALASSFIYDKERPAVVRFVSRQKRFMSKLEAEMRDIAQVQIKEENQKDAVHVIPIHRSSFMSHHQFMQRCTNRLKAFFNNFDTWKRDFDKFKFMALQRSTPNFFKISSGPGYFVKWFPSTCSVIVTGTCEEVMVHQENIEKKFGISTSSPPSHGSFGSNPSLSDHYYSPPPRFSPPTPPFARQGFQYCGTTSEQRRRRTSSTDLSGDTGSEIIHFDTEEITPAVLKYVLHNSESRKQLEKCCKRLAKVMIKNDQGHIVVKVIINKDITPDKKEQVSVTVQKYFDRFSSTTKKYDKLNLKELVEKQPNMFMEKPGVYVKTFLETGTVKITGLNEKISEKGKELDFEMNAEIEEKTFPADVFIVMKQCLVWETVEKRLGQGDQKVSITEVEPGRIQYKGPSNAIMKAKKALVDVHKSLYGAMLDGLSPGQIACLESCRKSQRQFAQTGKNALDPLYKVFKEHAINGALEFRDSGIALVCPDRRQWEKAQNRVKSVIVHFVLDLNACRPDVPFSKKCKLVREKMENRAIYLKDQPNSKIIFVFCLQHQKTEIQLEVREIISSISDVEEVDLFYPLEEESARHVLNPHSECKLYKAKSVKLDHQHGKPGLSVTCEKEDIDSVKSAIEDMKIVCRKGKISGHSLYKYLTKDEKYLRVEKETKCSIFLKEANTKKKKQACQVTIKAGDILNESCDAIVNSTGSGASFSHGGQMSKALARRYGRDVLAAIEHYGTWIVKDKVYLCPSSGSLPWTYVLNAATPAGNQMENFILDLLCAADKQGLSSIALPTIGTGNMGLDPATVAQDMKKAFAQFCSGNVISLKEIKVVVYETSLFPFFKDISTEVLDPKSEGIVAKIYGTNDSNLQKAFDMLNEICDGSLLEEELPHTWTPMHGQSYEKVMLDAASKEYQAVKDKFLHSSPPYIRILMIERIQNPLLYKQFRGRKEMRQAETRQLFHGTTSENVDAICASNFDRSFAGENGTSYGRGVYFHVNSRYSARYAGTDPIKHVFLADVITGDFAQGQSSYKTAPEKGNKMLYDSVVDNILNPKIFVVFRDSSVYPSYLITFQ